MIIFYIIQMKTKIITIFLLLLVQLTTSNLSISPGDQAKVENGISSFKNLADDLISKLDDQIKLMKGTQPLVIVHISSVFQ